MYNDASQAFGNSLCLISSIGDAWSFKALSLFYLNKREEALEASNESIKINQNSTSAWNIRGLIFLNLRRYNESIQAYDRSIQAHDGIEIDLEDHDAWYNKGIALIKSGRYNESIQANDMAIRIMPGDSLSWYNKGIALYELQEYNKSITAFDNVLKLRPKDTNAWYNKGLNSYNLRKYNESIQAFNNATKLDPNNSKAWYNTGIALYSLNRFNESIQAYDRSIEIDPKYAEAFYGKGVSFDRLNKYDDALKAFDTATKINSSFKEAWYGKSNSLQYLNRSAEAAMAFAKAEDLGWAQERKAIIYIIFLSFYFLLGIFIYIYSSKTPISAEMIAGSVYVLGLLAFCWLLSSLYDFYSMTLFLTGGFLIGLITVGLWSLLGIPLSISYALVTSAFAKSEKRRKVPPKIIKLISILSILSFAIICSKFYFRYGIDSDQYMLDFIKYAFIFIFTMGFIVTSPLIIWALSSLDVDRNTRDIFLILQFGYLSLSALLLSAVLWVFGVGQTVIFASSWFLGIMLFLFIFAFLLPYLSGWQKEKKWRELLLEKQRAWIEEMLDILNHPIPSLYIIKLEKLWIKIESENIACEDGSIHGI